MPDNKSDEKSVGVEKIEYCLESLEKSTTPAAFVYSPEEKNVKRKIDRAFLPLVILILFTQFIDKTSINTAAVMGLLEDTHITKDQFGLVGGLFYFGYLAFQIPNNFLMQRLPISKYMGVILVVWGVSFGCTALASNFGVLAALRVILGFFEACTYPCMFLLISMFYRRHEQVLYFSYMFLANAFATSFGGLIAFGIGYMQGLNGLSAWQYSYIIWGVITCALGVLTFFFLPDQPKSRWFRLTPEEHVIVDQRAKDNGMAADTKFNINHIYEGLKDPRFYCYCALSFLCNLQNGSITIFSSQIIQEIGFTNLQAILLNIPNGASGAILISISSFLSKRYHEINLVAMGMTLVSMAGVLILALVPSGPGKLPGIYLAYGCTPMYILIQTNISNNVKGYSKKVFYTSSQLVFYTLGNFVGPQCMSGNQAPRYMGAMLGYTGANILCFILYGFIRWSVVRSNSQRARQLNSDPTAGQLGDGLVDDRTDVTADSHPSTATDERTLRQVLAAMNATKLAQLFDTNELGDYLNNTQQSLTLLVPPNEALDESLIPQNDIEEWLKYHLIDQRMGPETLVDGALLKTKAGRDLLGAGNKQRIRVHVTVQDKGYHTSKQSIQFDRAVVVGEPVSTTYSYAYPVSQAVELPLDILELLPTHLDLSTLVALLYQSDADHELQQAKGITLFAPTNEAFERLGMVTKHLLQPSHKKHLAKVLAFHAIRGTFYTNEMESGEYTVPTLLDEEIHLNKTTAGVFMRGYGAADGNDRSVIGRVISTEEQVLIKNGAVLKVDRVQLPSSLKITNHDLLTSSGTTNSFLDLLEQANLVDLMDSSDGMAYVVLAPSDRAFNRMNFTQLLEDQDLVNRIARLHILPIAMPQMTLISGGGEWAMDNKHQEITTTGTEFKTLYEDEKVLVTLVEEDTSMYTVHVKNSLQDKAQVIGMGRVTNGGGVIEIDRVLLPSYDNDLFALSWWCFLLIVLAVLAVSALVVLGGYYGWLWWKRRQDGYSALEDNSDDRQEEQPARYTQFAHPSN